MLDDLSISIPTDNDGYLLLKCSHCGNLFKLKIDDFQDDSVLHIFCPSCGLTSDNFLTDEAISLAITVLQNKVMDDFYGELKKVEKQFDKNSFITFKVEAKPKKEPEIPIRSRVEALMLATLPCCNKTIKLKPILKMTGFYCPFCGVKNFEIK